MLGAGHWLVSPWLSMEISWLPTSTLISIFTFWVPCSVAHKLHSNPMSLHMCEKNQENQAAYDLVSGAQSVDSGVRLS